MDRQTTLEREQEGDYASTHQGPSTEQGLRALAHDLLTLGELQVELFKLDAREATGNVVKPVVMAVVSTCLFLGTVPVLLAALAFGLSQWLEWRLSLAFLVSGLIGLALAATPVLIARSHWGNARPFFRRSSSELEQNLTRVRSLLQSRDTPHRPR